MSKSRIPYFDFYPSDFMHGVRGLSAQDVGVYTMILCRIYEENGPVEYNPLRLATYCGMRESTFVKTLEKLVTLDKFQVDGGMIFNRRAAIEISNRADKLKINSKAGKASAEKRQRKQWQDATDVQRAFNHTDTDTDTEPEYSSDNSEIIIDVGDGADAPPPSRYEFETKHIRLTARDFRKWQEAYPHLSLKARLMALDGWAGSKGKDWFHAVSARLGKEEQAALERQKARYEQPAVAERSRDGRPGLAGYPFYVDARI